MKMNDINEQEVLAKIRTLLALERNFLAEERTALAEFRNGLALIIIGPTVSTIIAYMLSVFNVEKSILLDALNFAFFTILTIVGIWISFRSQSKLKIIKKKKATIKNRTIEISKSSKEIYNLLGDCVEDNNKGRKCI
jgi:uncharacterized membrane protein YidH (DUF202 family)